MSIHVRAKLISEGDHFRREFKSSLPMYSNGFAAGADLYAAEETTLYQGIISLVRTGICLEIPSGYEGQIRSRSGMTNEGIIVVTTGTIDSDYRGEIKVPLIFISPSSHRRKYIVKEGDRIAQIVFSSVARATFEIVQELTDTERGAKGFGSTGR